MFGHSPNYSQTERTLSMTPQQEATVVQALQQIALQLRQINDTLNLLPSYLSQIAQTRK